MAKILIVDDSPTEMHILKSAVEEAGHDVVTAENGEDGVTAASDHKPDAILMDVVMPGMNGFQATRKISKNADTADIPIVMVTTKDQRTDKEWGLRQGATAYLVKPVQKKELIEKINEVLA
ncbi:MAG: response regulator [Gammaproteobacteria bacterium]|jgi:twitching motility two-component system response regulator PilH|nr:response regulator [Gammaproteobacteria bacterium]